MHRTGMIPSTFVADSRGSYRIDRAITIVGEPVPRAERLDVRDGVVDAPGAAFALQGVTSALRYVERREKAALDPVSPALGRPEATRAALIPIRKSDAWWALTQDERRIIFEERSRHIVDSMPYLPRIARRLYHSRELGGPFDFLTWFEFAPEHAQAFDDMLGMLRAREEWTFVEREVEIRLSR